MTPEELEKKVEFTQRELPDFDQVEILARLTYIATERVDKFLLAGNLEDPKKVMERIKKDLVRQIFHDVYVQYREDFYRYMRELRYELDFMPNSKAEQILKQIFALFN